MKFKFSRWPIVLQAIMTLLVLTGGALGFFSMFSEYISERLRYFYDLIFHPGAKDFDYGAPNGMLIKICLCVAILQLCLYFFSRRISKGQSFPAIELLVFLSLMVSIVNFILWYMMREAGSPHFGEIFPIKILDNFSNIAQLWYKS